MALRKKTNKPKPKRKSATRTKDKPSREKPGKKPEKHHNGSAGNPWHRTKAKRGRAKPPLKPRRPTVRVRR